MRSRLSHSASRVALGAALLALGSLPAAATDLDGLLVDSRSGIFLEGADVRLVEAGVQATTDQYGRFLLRNLAPGTYTLEVRYTGYPAETRSISVADQALDTLVIGLGGAQEEIVVTGNRLAQRQAIQQKKVADSIIESLFATDIGKLPDANVAEAIRRLPGLSVENDQGEGRYVTVRGVDADLNAVTINGQTIGAPEGDGRRVKMDVIPSSLISSLQVVKAVTPDLDHNALGGVVNVETLSAFDRKVPFIFGRIEGGWFEQGGDMPYAGDVTMGSRFGTDGQFGIVLSANYSLREYETDNVQGGAGWDEQEDSVSGEEFLVPEEIQLRDYFIERERFGLVGNLDWRPTETVELYLRSMFASYTDHEIRHRTILGYETELEEEDCEEVVQPVNRVSATQASFPLGFAEKLMKDREETEEIFSVTAGGSVILDRLTLDLAGGYAETSQDTPYDHEWEFTSESEEIPLTLFYGSFLPTYAIGGGYDINDPANFEFNEVARGGELTEETLWQASADLRYELDGTGYLKGGARYLTREKTRDVRELVYEGPDLTLDQLAIGSRSLFGSAYPMGPRIGPGAAESYFRDNAGDFEFDEDDAAIADAVEDYEADETVTAVYAMASIDLMPTLTVLGGLRAEFTRGDYTAFQVVVQEDEDLVIARRSGGNDYNHVLPGLHVTWEPVDDLLVRGAWTNTIGRPNFADLVPALVIEDDELVVGNPDLKPYESTNFDLSVEYYLPGEGLLALGAFHKDIDNPIFRQVFEVENQSFGGIAFEEAEVETPINGRNGKLRGVELTYTQTFDFLPGILAGLGASVNMAFIDSESQVPLAFADASEGFRKVPLFRQSERVGNAALFYTLAGFEARAALSYRSDYLDELGEDADTDIYVDEHTQLDIKLSYQVTEQVQVFAEALNITDEPWVRYYKDGNRINEEERYGWSARFGLGYRF